MYQFEGKLGWNMPWVILYKMCVFYINQKSKMATIRGHSFKI